MGQASERGTLRRSDSEHISLSRNVVIACPTATVTGSPAPEAEAGTIEARTNTPAARAGSGA
jgi:hypothetical protein